ncbi:MAG: glycoside hydrolase family 92 protein [Draconibacterium sp.]
MSPCEEGYKYVGTVGTIGQYAGNQPSHHVAYLYSYSGEPWKTQYYTCLICENIYKADPEGCPENDDMGSMSSWYNFSSMGFYPVTPCSNTYVLGSPVFNEVDIKLDNGKTFQVKTFEQLKNKYLCAVGFIKRKELNRNWITHDEIMNGGVLEFEMGKEPP